ncbi:MAG: DUF2892 domain-containing protein [Bacteroidetes bacterium]|nr:DUF2892 domain-containing protein [Bacteroidota bacterium]
MIKNMGSTDRIVRIIVAVVISILYFTKTVEGTTATVLLIVGAIFLATAFMNFCPLYLPFGISTRKKKD